MPSGDVVPNSDIMYEVSVWDYGHFRRTGPALARHLNGGSCEFCPRSNEQRGRYTFLWHNDVRCTRGTETAGAHAQYTQYGTRSTSFENTLGGGCGVRNGQQNSPPLGELLRGPWTRTSRKEGRKGTECRSRPLKA